MSVKQWGEGDETALMLHCTLAQAGAWGPLARHLGGRLAMIAPDLVAHGEGPAHDPARDFHDQATEAAAGHLPDAPCHLIGHSFGATIALRLALDHPDRVKSLTLIEPVLFCVSNGPCRLAHDAHAIGVTEALARGDKVQAARIFLGLWGSEDFGAMPDARQSYIIDRIWIPDATEPALMRDRADLLPRLPGLHVPTLLLQGEMSPPVIGEINTRLRDILPNATCQTLEGASHMAPLTHAQATAEAIAAFLDRV